jgi:hypothetical protein
MEASDKLEWQRRTAVNVTSQTKDIKLIDNWPLINLGHHMSSVFYS